MYFYLPLVCNDTLLIKFYWSFISGWIWTGNLTSNFKIGCTSSLSMNYFIFSSKYVATPAQIFFLFFWAWIILDTEAGIQRAGHYSYVPKTIWFANLYLQTIWSPQKLPWPFCFNVKPKVEVALHQCYNASELNFFLKEYKDILLSKGQANWGRKKLTRWLSLSRCVLSIPNVHFKLCWPP